MNREQSEQIQSKKTGSFPLYPLFLGMYPILALIAINVAEIDLALTIRPLLLSIALAAVVFGVLRLVLRDWTRAAILASIFLILFFSYGQVYTLLRSMNNPDLIFAHHRVLILIWTGLLAVSAWFVTRKSLDLANLTGALNIISILLLVYPLFQVVRFEVVNQANKPAAAKSALVGQPPQAYPQGPDIYYIVLDAYMRADSIQAIYGYDNSGFVNALTQKGFYVANCGVSNYANTQASMTSSLNMEYLDTLSVVDNEQANIKIQTSAVRRFLEARGYTTVAFETGWNWSQWKDADVYYAYQPLRVYLYNPFEALFLQTTALRAPLDLSKVNVDTTPDLIEHDRIIYNLNTLKYLPLTVDSPKFVFAHLIVPHPPYVFKPNGDFIQRKHTPEDDQTGYQESLTFINRAILDVVDQILAGSKTPPIIVIQGDHGSFLYHTHYQRMTNLNAYYLPGGKAAPYATITPVNTFRMIFNAYFGQNYPLLKDSSWYAPLKDPYNLEPVPNTCGK